VHKNLVFIPTQNGIVMAIDTKKNEIAWQYKVSNTLVNNLVPTKNNEVFGTTMDGKVFCLKYK
jgi:outer membrane protein assembly factor BamB